MLEADQNPRFLAGLDENGLGARLGPMLVTGVLACVSEDGLAWLSRRLPAALKADLDDSKNLVSFKNCDLGEAWARAIFSSAPNPGVLLDALVPEGEVGLRKRCPKSSEAQCWSCVNEEFRADSRVVRRVTRHLDRMASRGVRIVAVRSQVLCVRQLNDERQAGGNRFVSDLHAMERLILNFRHLAGTRLNVRCGKVGGIADYDRYFGPLSGYLRVTLTQSRRISAYRFPDVGDVEFVQDADGSDRLVMLASLVGKYARELLMSRISRYYVSRNDSILPASGYHDPVTRRLVQLSAPLRRKARIANGCFERAGNE